MFFRLHYYMGRSTWTLFFPVYHFKPVPLQHGYETPTPHFRKHSWMFSLISHMSRHQSLINLDVMNITGLFRSRLLKLSF